MKTTTTLAVLFAGACALQCSAQSFDSSGNGKLNGTYYFRQVLYFQQTGDAASITGNITFDGAGGYTLSNANLLDAASGSSTPVALTGSGTYSVAASGEGFLTAIDSADFPNDQIVGLVSAKGIFIGSTTETQQGYNDLFIAAPVAANGGATNATLSGSYQAAYFDWTYPGDALLTFSASNGNIGTVTATEYIDSNTSSNTQTLNGVTYNFTNGAAQINFGGSNTNNLIGGTEILYTSPDGSFIFGGNYNGFDMFVGVQNSAGTPANYTTLYYEAGIDVDESSNDTGLDSYYGSVNVLASGSNSQGADLIADERDNDQAFYGGSADYTYSDFYSLNTYQSSCNNAGTTCDSSYYYWSSNDGTTRIGYSPGPYLGINVAFQAPSFTPSGVYISPVGVQNAASSAPFTAFVSPGEFLTLYGSNLAPATASSGVPFPTNLSGVQVMINGIAAPIYLVSPDQIDVVVPYDTTQAVAQIQVINNGTNSNMVTSFVGETSVGAFTNNPTGGIGIAAAERPDYSVVSESNPAQVGETVAVYLSGMGVVSPGVADGTGAPSSPLSYTDQSPDVYLTDTSGNSAQATASFSGLAPELAGVYQIDFAIPSGLDTGDTLLDIFSGADSETAESILPITNTTSSTVAAHFKAGEKRAHARHRRYNVRIHAVHGRHLSASR
jgi:uncharacterized protein (TIGR03437 family)